MDYGITCLVMSPTSFLAIPRERYVSLRRAKRGLMSALSLEEKLDFLLESHAEYEQELLTLTLRHMMHLRELDSPRFRMQTQAVGRRLVHVLSMARMFNDHLAHEMCEVFGDASPERLAVKAKCSVEYDSRLGYRFMEALRNQVQHHSLPLQALAYPSQIHGREIEFRITPEIPVVLLQANKRFQRRVLQDLGPSLERVPVTPHLRDYVEGLFAIHEVARDALMTRVKRWERRFMKARRDATAAIPEAKSEFGIVARRPDGTWKQAEYLPRWIVPHRRYLERKNSSLDGLSRCYVSSRVDKAP